MSIARRQTDGATEPPSTGAIAVITKCEKMAGMNLVRLAVLMLAAVIGVQTASAQASAPQEPAPPARAPANRDAMYEFMLARRAEAADDLKGAQARLERAIVLDPTSAELRAELAGFFARQNKAEDAVAAAERALSLDAESEEGHRILGLVYSAWAEGAVAGPAGGSTESWRATALEHLQKMQSTPTMATDLGLQMTFARQLLAADQPAKAVPVLERLVAQTGTAAEPLTMLAEAHRALGQLDRATAVMEEAAASNPRFYLSLGDLYERQQQWEAAANAYEKGAGATRVPGRELMLRQASALLNIPNGAGAERAVAVLTNVVASNATDVTAQYLLAQAHEQRGDVASAETAALAVLSREPRHLSALGLLAGLYGDRYAFDKIVTLLAPLDTDAAAPEGTRVGEFVRLLVVLGGARQQSGDTAAAVRTFARAQRLLPDAPPLAAALAQAHLQAKQYDEAQRVAREARKAAVDDLGLIRLEALAGVKAGRAAEAVAGAEHALTSRRDQVDAAFVLADVYQEAKRFDDAVKAVAAVSAKAPGDDAIAFRLAAAYETAGRIADAERTFRGILTRDPLNANALNYLGYMLASRNMKVAEALTLVDRALATEPAQPRLSRQPGLGALQDGAQGGRRSAVAQGGIRAQEQFGHPVSLRRRAGRARQEGRGGGGPRAGACRRRPRRGPQRPRTSAAPARPTPPMTRMATLVLAAVVLSACAGKAPPRPSGTATPDSSAVQAHVAATRHCRPLRTGTSEIALSGRVGRQRMRARLVAGFAAPASIRLEALAPFGAPALVLASDGATTTLLFPRERQVLRGAAVADVLEATTGLGLGADELRAVLFGCLGTTSAGVGSRFVSDWQAVDADGARVFLHHGVLVAADYRGWHVDYAAHAAGVPRSVRVRRTGVDGAVDLSAALSQVELNVDVPAEAFVIAVPDDAVAITLNDLRAASPLAAREP